MGIAVPLALSGCNTGDIDTVAPTAQNVPLSDVQIVGFVTATAQGEQQEAQIEVTRGAIPPAQQLAQAFIGQDAQLIQQAQIVTGLSPAASPEVTALTEGLVMTSNVLAAMNPPALDVAWICAQLQGQVQVIQLYDARVLPSAMTPVLVEVATQGRAVAVAHQQATMQLAAQLGITFSPQAGPGMTCVPPPIPPAPGPGVNMGD